MHQSYGFTYANPFCGSSCAFKWFLMMWIHLCFMWDGCGSEIMRWSDSNGEILETDYAGSAAEIVVCVCVHRTHMLLIDSVVFFP